MDRRVLWTVMLILGTALTVSCGDDSDGSGDGAKAGTSGGKAGNNGGMKITCEANEVSCGTKCCGMATGSMAPACCADDFAGECGMSVNAFGSTAACVRQVENFMGCPPLVIPVINFTLPSCCTPEKMCGIDGSVFGMGGCTELGEAAKRAMQMIMMGQMTPATPPATDDDGGVAGAGGMTGGAAGRTGAGGRMGFPMITFPPPQACPSN